MFSFEATHRRGTATLYILLSFSVSSGLCLSCRKQKIGIYGETVLCFQRYFYFDMYSNTFARCNNRLFSILDKTGNSVTLNGICCMLTNSKRCTKPTPGIAIGVECEVTKRGKRFCCLEGCSLISAEG